MRFDRRIFGKRLLIGSAVLFALSLGFQCFYCEGESVDWPFGNGSGSGLLLLMIGWIGLIEHEYAWLANPCYAFAMFIAFSTFKDFSKPEKLLTNPDQDYPAAIIISKIFSVAATLLALSFLFQTSTYMAPGPAGTQRRIAGYLAGYFLWVASMVVELVGVAVLLTHRIQADDRGSEI